jgi:hypothetical protein
VQATENAEDYREASPDGDKKTSPNPDDFMLR